MTDSRAQTTYQVRLGWGAAALTELAESPIIIVIDAVNTLAIDGEASHQLAERAGALPHRPTVFLGSLRNATASARAAYDEQVARGNRTAINLVLVGDENGGFAVEDYLAAGAVADALTSLGIDHSSPEVAVAAEGFRPLTRALKHLLSASVSGQTLKQVGRTSDAKAAAELDAEPTAIRLAN